MRVNLNFLNFALALYGSRVKTSAVLFFCYRLLRD